MKLVREDQYRKYMDFIVAQRKLRLSRLETKCWANVRARRKWQATTMEMTLLVEERLSHLNDDVS